MSKYFSSYLGSQRSSLGSKMFWRVVIHFFCNQIKRWKMQWGPRWCLRSNTFKIGGQLFDQLRGLWRLQSLIIDTNQDGGVAFADVNSTGSLLATSKFSIAGEVHVLDSSTPQSRGLEGRWIFHSIEDFVYLRSGDLKLKARFYLKYRGKRATWIFFIWL